MRYKNPRIAVTLDQELISFLSDLALKEGKSISNIIKEYVLEAIDKREDKALSTIAHKRELENTVLISHEDVWK